MTAPIVTADPWEQLGRDLALERHSHVHPEYRPSARQREAEARMVEAVRDAERRLSIDTPQSSAQPQLRTVPDKRTVA